MTTSSTLNNRPAPARQSTSRLDRQAIARLEQQVQSLSARLDRLQQALQGDALMAPDQAPQRRQRAGARTDHLAPPAQATGFAGALARGEQAKLDWIRHGELISAHTLAHSWGLSPQALGPAAKRQELFAITHKRCRYYPAEFLTLERSVIATVNQALAGLPEGDKLVFWKRPHGALGGNTVVQSLQASPAKHIDAVVSLAHAWRQQQRH